MKYLKLFEDYKDIDAICQEYYIENYTINEDGTIDVGGDVFLQVKNKLPLKFNRVSGNFYCNDNKLVSLEGAPRDLGGDFYCNYNNLTSLEGAPKWVGGNFYCNDNKLVSLEGAPRDLGGDFYCRYNQLTTLEGAPKEIGGDFYCEGNNLTTLEGAPKKISGNFYCSDNPLPQLIYDNYQYIEEIIKWQDEYNIWRGGELDEFRFGEMMIDIKNEIGS